MVICPEIIEQFIDRFPRYALSWPAWPMDEAGESFPPASIGSLPLESAKILYLYGIGDGSVALLLQEWLQRDTSHRLIFLESKPERMIQFLHQPYARQILNNRQVEIFHLPSNRERKALIQELSERFPVRGAFVALNPQLPKREYQKMARVKWQLLRKTALTHATWIDRSMQHVLLSHLLRNIRHLPSSFYINRMKDAFQNIPAVICGAGPSLAQSIDTLRQIDNRALIFAGGSAIAALTRHHVMPHFAVAIDPNPDEMQRIQNSFAFEVPLLFSSRLFPGCFSALNGPYGYVRSGMAGILELWLEEELHLDEPMLGEYLSDESLSVTMLSAAIAYHLGCNPILFDGLDLAYSQNRRYADGVNFEQELEDQKLQPIDRHLMKKDRHHRPVMSALRFVMESDALSQFARKHPERRLVNCTQGGIGWKGVENIPLSTMKESLTQSWDLRAWIHRLIQQTPLSVSSSDVFQKIRELQESLKRVVGHLEILANAPSPGRRALAEMEMKEEVAYSILFYDVALMGRWMQPDPMVTDWNIVLKLAQKCLEVLLFQ